MESECNSILMSFYFGRIFKPIIDAIKADSLNPIWADVDGNNLIITYKNWTCSCCIYYNDSKKVIHQEYFINNDFFYISCKSVVNRAAEMVSDMSEITVSIIPTTSIDTAVNKYCKHNSVNKKFFDDHFYGQMNRYIDINKSKVIDDHNFSIHSFILSIIAVFETEKKKDFIKEEIEELRMRMAKSKIIEIMKCFDLTNDEVTGIVNNYTIESVILKLYCVFLNPVKIRSSLA